MIGERILAAAPALEARRRRSSAPRTSAGTAAATRTGSRGDADPARRADHRRLRRLLGDDLDAPVPAAGRPRAGARGAPPLRRHAVRPGCRRRVLHVAAGSQRAARRRGRLADCRASQARLSAERSRTTFLPANRGGQSLRRRWCVRIVYEVRSRSTHAGVRPVSRLPVQSSTPSWIRAASSAATSAGARSRAEDRARRSCRPGRPPTSRACPCSCRRPPSPSRPAERVVDLRAQLLCGRLLPVRPVVERVELDVRDAEPLREPAGEGRLPGAAGTHHGDLRGSPATTVAPCSAGSPVVVLVARASPRCGRLDRAEPRRGRLDLVAFPGYAEAGGDDPRVNWVRRSSSRPAARCTCAPCGARPSCSTRSRTGATTGSPPSATSRRC